VRTLLLHHRWKHCAVGFLEQEANGLLREFVNLGQLKFQCSVVIEIKALNVAAITDAYRLFADVGDAILPSL